MSAARRRSTPWGLRGRTLLLGALAAFLVVASAAVWRRSRGVAVARELRALEQRRRALRTEVITLGRDIRLAERQVPVEAARRLGMHVAGEQQTRLLTAGDPLAPRTPAP
ncbi:MAG: hypothetical protein KJT01_01725 [Gemmatimonadetes bacterium]|nr:hypothetical protein [Gemmatimonadota bacterium]